MRRIVVSQFVSLDGVIEDPVGIESLGRGAWSSSTDSGPEGAKLKVDEMMESEAMLLGRKTYDGYLAAWPGRGGDYADKINSMPKYVVSSTLREPEWNNTTVLSGDLVDEWRLMVYPTIVGRGRRCFGDPGRAVDLELVDSQMVGDGVAIMIYRPARN